VRYVRTSGYLGSGLVGVVLSSGLFVVVLVERMWRRARPRVFLCAIRLAMLVSRRAICMSRLDSRACR
jgi:hypothetical protein